MINHGIALLLALLGGALTGYKVGARALEDIQRESERAKLAHEEVLQRMKQELSALEGEHERKAQEMGQTFQAKKQELQGSLAAREARLADVEARKQQVADELDRTVKSQQAASGAEQQKLQEKEHELQALQEQLEQQRAGLDCLAIAVPGDEIRILNDGEAQAARAQR